MKKISNPLINTSSEAPILIRGPASISERFVLYGLGEEDKKHIEVNVYDRKRYRFVLVQPPGKDFGAGNRARTLAELVEKASKALDVSVDAKKVPKKIYTECWIKDTSIYSGIIRIDNEEYEFYVDNNKMFSSTRIKKK